jgi:hypothetical protein
MNTDEALRLIFEKAPDEDTAYDLISHCWKIAYAHSVEAKPQLENLITVEEGREIIHAFWEERPSKPQAWRIADEVVRNRMLALEKFKSVKVASYSRAQRLIESMKQPGFIALPDGGRGMILRVA